MGGRVDFSAPEAAFDRAERFDEEARALMTSDPSAATALSAHRDWALAAPTPDHFQPLLYLAGLAAAPGAPPTCSWTATPTARSP